LKFGEKDGEEEKEEVEQFRKYRQDNTQVNLTFDSVIFLRC